MGEVVPIEVVDSERSWSHHPLRPGQVEGNPERHAPHLVVVQFGFDLLVGVYEIVGLSREPVRDGNARGRTLRSDNQTADSAIARLSTSESSASVRAHLRARFRVDEDPRDPEPRLADVPRRLMLPGETVNRHEIVAQRE